MVHDPPRDIRSHLDELNEWFQDGTLFTTFDGALPRDMDSKDWDYQRILYRPEEKREV
ncbi:hypothetical protein [Paenibacillus sp. GM2FR]|uniref:hypothetical protein n=1 Tax=Paenibacillus sp. GM2FR TaxID=2059268 RepID=UPI0013FDCF67|nr:hypothetical protein [Paenibacillus sp. GM2FR]